MKTFTVYAPGAWCDDIMPAMESWAMDLENADYAKDNAGMVEVLAQYEDGSRGVRRGKGYAHRFDLTIEGVTALREEALYRFEFNGGNGSPYGAEDPDYAAKRASKTLMDRCDAILTEVTT